MRQILKGCSQRKTCCFLKIIYCSVLVGQQCEFNLLKTKEEQESNLILPEHDDDDDERRMAERFKDPVRTAL